MDLREPKRKRVGPHIKPQQHFPIPIQSESGFPISDGLLPLYIGNFVGDCVVISNTEEMTSLYKMGFFGKGSFSRGFPSFSLSKKGTPQIIKERQWKRRKVWAEKIEHNLSQAQQEEADVRDSLNNTLINAMSHGQIEDDHTIDTSLSGNETVQSNSTTQIKGSNSLAMDEEELNVKECNVEQKFSNECLLDSKTSSNEETSGMDIDQNENVDTVPVEPNLSENTGLLKDLSSASKFGDDVSLYQSLLQSTKELNSEVLVLADSDDENLESVLQNPQPHLESEQFKTVVETLNLTLEEAFFLSFGLGCLQVNYILGQPMSLIQLWQTFCEVKPNFIESYVCYHYFRAKGWVVKSGYKFGGDFLLYKQGPPFYHASYIVLVEKVDFCLRRAGNDLTWTKHHGLNRLAENSGKDIIICQVVFPANVNEKPNMVLKSLSKFQVKEKLIKRWVPSHKRTEKDDEHD